MFHLLCREMAPTLQDMTFLTGLPYAGFPLTVYDILATWCTEFLARFQQVLPPDSGYREFSSTHGPKLRWICQFYPERMAEDAPDHIVRRHFEAYLLWLFGWVMFLGSHGNIVDKHYIRYTRELVDCEVKDIHPYAWGSAVLCTTYRRLCNACHRLQDSSVLSGCPLFLQPWSFEPFQIGRPQLDLGAYTVSLYAEDDDVDWPTMGTVWCRRRVTYTLITTHLCQVKKLNMRKYWQRKRSIVYGSTYIFVLSLSRYRFLKMSDNSVFST